MKLTENETILFSIMLDNLRGITEEIIGRYDDYGLSDSLRVNADVLERLLEKTCQ